MKNEKRRDTLKPQARPRSEKGRPTKAGVKMRSGLRAGYGTGYGMGFMDMY